MKKFIFLLVCTFTLGVLSAQSDSTRFKTRTTENNTYRVLTLSSTTVTPVTATVTIPALTKFTNYVSVATTSLSPTFTANVSSSYYGDQMNLFVKANATGTRTITLGTNLIVTATTQTVAASKKALFTFMFDGSKWVETARCVEQ